MAGRRELCRCLINPHTLNSLRCGPNWRSTAPRLPSPSEPPAAERDQGPSQVEQALRDLQSALTEAADSAEDVIAEHPIPSVVAAVLLGFVVGWLAARV
ncbi:MAG TPA: hypothetical protein VK281_19945 [Xanthobacteraceae bacterium]|nr:hypothetical protein [Xanthobacteraceae bacterium]